MRPDRFAAETGRLDRYALRVSQHDHFAIVDFCFDLVASNDHQRSSLRTL
jgi:hypothetical protein